MNTHKYNEMVTERCVTLKLGPGISGGTSGSIKRQGGEEGKPVNHPRATAGDGYGTHCNENSTYVFLCGNSAASAPISTVMCL
jgi:hypothetical protein